MTENRYIAVLKDLIGTYKGIVTSNSFESKEAFDKWRKHGTEGYLVVEEGLSEERADEICAQSNTLDVLLAIAKREAAEAPAGIQNNMLEGRLLEIRFLSKDPSLLAKKYLGNRN